MVQSLSADALSYYEAAIPAVAASFRGIPFAWNAFSDPVATPRWHGPLAPQSHRVPTVSVAGTRGPARPYFALEPYTLEWLVKDHGAVEFHSWTPTQSDPLALRFARILLEEGDTVAAGAVRDAALLMRDLLASRHLTAIPLLDGTGGIALYLPFDDAPAYVPVRTWLHALANDAAAAYPNAFTTEPNSAGGTRVHVHVTSNAPGLHSALPYSLRGPDQRYAVAPVTWSELAALAPGALRFEAAQTLHRLQTRGDLFAAQLAAIAPQHFAGVASTRPQVMVAATQPRGHVIRAAIEVLADGRSRDAQTILTDAIGRGLLTGATSEKYVYTALTEFIARSKGHDRKPPIVQNPDRTFRMNEPLDDWPDVALPQPPAPGDATNALIARLQKTVAGNEPAAWEVAVCDAFAHLGFRATHLGGNKAPDGTIDAQLGPLGYRAMLECKHGTGVVTQPDAGEAAKWSQQYHAQYRTLIGPGFSEEVELHDELLAHEVSAWTIDDLVTALEEALNPLELQPCFAPGFAEDAMTDVLWNRNHGERKRIAYAAGVIAEEGWKAQIAAATQADPQNAAHLTVDAAMLLVQQHLTAAGATRACTREEIGAAFIHLTDPVFGRAVTTADGIVITMPA